MPPLYPSSPTPVANSVLPPPRWYERLALALLTGLGRLPLPVLHLLGTLLGWIAYALDQRYRERMRAHLWQSGLWRPAETLGDTWDAPGMPDAAGGHADAVELPDSSHAIHSSPNSSHTIHIPHLSNMQTADAQHAYRKLLYMAIQEQGKAACEALAVWQMSRAEIARRVRYQDAAGQGGRAHFERALATRQAVLLVTPHLGCFEIAGRFLAQSVATVALYRPPKMRWIEPLMRAGRVLDGETSATAPATPGGVRVMIRALRERHAVIVLPDQVPSHGNGVWAPFFSRPAYTMTLLARLAHSSGACVLFFCGERLTGGKYRVHLRPMHGAFNGDEAHDAALLNRNLEKLIALAPAQYLWSYHRYKNPAERS